ncbi:hypothetical protein ACHWQZ_G000992 [Mnemiopsis leidyi]
MEETKSEIAREVLAQEASGNITSKDKTLITGLNSDNNMKRRTDYRPVPPKIRPLFKVHKLSEAKIKDKVIPPQRFINAAKHGPLYKLGQRSSPHLTKISKSYCGEEFLLDTPHLLKKVEEYNMAPQEGNVLLATLDVEALYPSINPDLAIEAMRHAFESDNTTTGGIKEALLKFTELSFKRSCVTFRDNIYKSKIGIPTAHFWIKFGSWELGKEINFLDITLYLDGSNRIQYKLYTKPTDALNYPRTDSFHPNHVFNSVAFSQMLRVANRNSREETRQSDLQQLKSDLHRSGHDMAKFDNLEVKVREQSSSSSATTVEETAHPKTNIVFPVQYFLELPQLKAVLRDIESDIEVLLGPTKIVTASKKGRSIGNKILRNSSICRSPIEGSSNWVQSCNAPRCLTCKHMRKAGDVFVVILIRSRTANVVAYNIL